MRNYGKVTPTFWIRGSGKKLRGHKAAQILALYLFTGQLANMCGVYYLPLVQMAYETGLSLEEVQGALTLLADPGVDVAYYDEDAELVWVPSLAAYQVGPELKPGDKQRVALLRELDSHGTHPFVAAFWRRYQVPYRLDTSRQFQLPGVVADRPSGVADMPLRSPSVRAMGSQEQEQEQEQEQDSPDTSGPRVDPDPVTASKSKPKRGGRAARSLIPEDWQPPADVAAKVTADGYDVQAITADMVNYWRGSGKLMADWTAVFRQNYAKILRTDWLRDQFRLPPQPLPPKLPPGAAAPVPSGPPAAAPPGVVERMRDFANRQSLPFGDPDGPTTGVTPKLGPA